MSLSSGMNLLKLKVYLYAYTIGLPHRRRILEEYRFGTDGVFYCANCGVEIKGEPYTWVLQTLEAEHLCHDCAVLLKVAK